MIPWRERGRAHTPDGSELVLSEHDGDFSIRVDGYELMSSRKHGSEESMAEIGCADAVRKSRPSVLVGGLGLGYTLRATLDRMPEDARVTVAELVPAVVDWNRDILGHLAGKPLADPRVEVFTGDVAALLKQSRQAFDVILLDVDNGPTAMTSSDNKWLYGMHGLSTIHQALQPGGVVIVWSAGPDSAFEDRMRKTGFKVDRHHAAARATGKGGKHTLFRGRRGER